MRLTLILLILLCACTNNKLVTEEKEMDQADTLLNEEVSQSQEPVSGDDDSTVYIGQLDAFMETQEFYTPLYFQDGINNRNSFEYLNKNLDSLVSDQEGSRRRLPMAIAKRFFRLGGMNKITVYNEKSSLISEARLIRVELYDDLIERGFIAVYKPLVSGAFTGDVAFCVGETNASFKRRDFDHENFEVNKLAEMVLEKLERKADFMIAYHTRLLPDSIIYTIIAFEKGALLTETKGEQVVILKEVKDDSHFFRLIPLPKEINEKPVLLVSMAVHDTDVSWTSLAVFLDGQYEFMSGNRLKLE